MDDDLIDFSEFAPPGPTLRVKPRARRVRFGPFSLPAGVVAISGSILIHVLLVLGAVWVIAALQIHIPWGGEPSQFGLLDHPAKPDAQESAADEGSPQLAFSGPYISSGGSLSTLEQLQRDIDMPIAGTMAPESIDPPDAMPDQSEDQSLPTLAELSGSPEPPLFPTHVKIAVHVR